jgi:hypothetical protein
VMLKPDLKRLAVVMTSSVLLAAQQGVDVTSGPASSKSIAARATNNAATVLYEGPLLPARLVHEQNWTIKAGPPGPDNQKFRDLGATCSMIPSDVHNVAGSGFERVTFEAQSLGLGLWKMAWSEAIVGTATDCNNYTYYQRF